MKVFDKVVIIKGRLRGETGRVVGFSDLNMEHVAIVSRDNKKARDKCMGFRKGESSVLRRNPI